MSNYYNENEHCMKFKNDEIDNFLIKPLLMKKDYEIVLLNAERKTITINSDEEIRCLGLDGDKRDFFILFYGHQTSIFLDSTEVNEEIMFIDDKAKEVFNLGDTYGNIVYEDDLRNKSHKEILHILYDFVIAFDNSKKIEVKEVENKNLYRNYPCFDYYVTIKSNVQEQINVQYANINIKKN